ncbi:MAG: dockerin type I repeat-containing protein [Armatimonadetes bacterium]|nr:dockerin type I repeat-containing protein [Armatimonadota bacterium]
MGGLTRITRGALAALAALSLAAPVHAQLPTNAVPLTVSLPSKGDVNRDGLINLKDAHLTLQSLLGVAALSPEQQTEADADGNGAVNIEDVVRILQQSVGIAVPLSAEVKRPTAVLNGNLDGLQVLPPDNEWNRPVDRDPVDPNSDTLVNSIGRYVNLHPDFGANWNGGPFGIPYVVTTGDFSPAQVQFDYADESDPGPYPIPVNAPIEGGPDSDGDRHVIVVDRDRGKLYEMFYSFPNAGNWTAASGAIFDLNSNALRPAGWTSADAAGLPIFPGLVRYEEVEELKEIRHALRFTVKNSRRAYVHPARHFASSKTDPALPPMGMRVRLKANFDISGFPPSAQVILKALKKYGMFLADNGGNWFLSGAPDSRWNDEALSTLKRVKGDHFEVVKMGPLTTR